ncbi:hypothetical protein Emtol_3732 [Emticicia oligotrophica DSM 17448]|uniref:Uncharacterized protein n=1 Tax=Emticicia oligotrophica (strain DSM 17448 / CIP 109782 / MTCC 6937 / GPTSA100-15) TaxID=929562 RepID=A0ABM5N5S1_EMTOG|nr:MULTISPECIES: hypothetical protein [Emticicia]AFK04858.1 hypothetical protein Emtol_3732 [Emticicia oligotrophica DSM 17448]
MRSLFLKYLPVLLLCCVNFVSKSQDFHQRQAPTVEELILKKDPNLGYALFNKENYIVVENLRTSSRKKVFIGEVFRFRTKDGILFENEIHEVKDSTFVVQVFNETRNRFEYAEIKLDEIRKIYKRPKRELSVGWATLSPFGYLVFEWAAWGVSPLKNEKWPIALALAVAQPVFTVVSNQFRGRKVTENYRVRILKSF